MQLLIKDDAKLSQRRAMTLVIELEQRIERVDQVERKDLCFSCLRLGLIKHRRSLRSSHLSSQVFHDLHRVTLENAWRLRKIEARKQVAEEEESFRGRPHRDVDVEERRSERLP